jgi:amidohydrolase
MPNGSVQEPLLHKLKNLRYALHQKPELSGREATTEQTIESFLADTRPTHTIRKLGGNGIAFLYDSEVPGPRLGFRCELDALPIQESNNWMHRSRVPGVSHKCGHDGHMAITAGIGHWLKENPVNKGSILLLFQPAEETGEGAAAIVQDPRWEEMKPDWLFGLHNIPGYPQGEIMLKNGPFCAASKGLLLKMKGITSHAAEPEKGKNPSAALARIMLALEELPQQALNWNDLVLLTPVYARMGDKAFGTSAGYAEYGATLRAFQEEDMALLCREAEAIIARNCHNQQLPFELSYQEVFPATLNQPQGNTYVREAARAADLSLRELNIPFRWSEDFGWYGSSCPSVFFGLGAGKEQPALHHPDYDFPDAIIKPGLAVFVSLIRQIL